MKLTVLLDNNTIIDRYYLGEPGVSYFIQDEDTNILFDTGYSDAGICNIIEYAKKVCGIDKVADVIGGFHLLNPSDELLTKTIEYIRENHIEVIHAAHCTDLKSKIQLSTITAIVEVGVGLTLEYK